MRKSLRNKKKKSKSRKRYRGGSYYSYNKNPLLFTSNSIQTGGKMPTLNTRDTLIPQGIVDLGRNFIYNSSSNAMNGYYPPVNPDPSVQPINKTYMLL